MREASDGDDTVVVAETCFADSKGKSSDSDSVSVNESDSDTELLSPSKRNCYIYRSGRSTTNFAFRRFTTNWNVTFRTDCLLCRGSQWYLINKTVNKTDKLISAQRTVDRSERRHLISTSSFPNHHPLYASFFSLPSRLVKQKILLWRREEIGVTNKASVNVSLFIFIDTGSYL